jgi:hypothetical protein
MIPNRDHDVITNDETLTLTLFAKQPIAQNGDGPGTIRPYGLIEIHVDCTETQDGLDDQFQIDAILETKNGIESIEYFDLFDEDGVCLNEGQPWYPEDPANPDAMLTPTRVREFLSSQAL